MRICLLLVFAYALVPTALADDGAFYKQIASVDPLQSKAVQAELKVTEAQRAAFNKHADAYNATTKTLQDSLQAGTLNQTDFKKKVVEAQAVLHDKITDELTSTQTARLGQITLQRFGIVALLNPIVAERLVLTETQRKALADAWTKTGTQVAELERKAKQPIVEKYKAMDPPKTVEERDRLQGQLDQEIKDANARIEPDILKLKKDYEDVVDKTLTAGQKKTWADLLGPPFKPPKSGGI